MLVIIEETTFEALYQAVLRPVEDVAQVHLEHAGAEPVVEFEVHIGMDMEYDWDEWSADAWLSSEDDTEARKFVFYYRFANRLEYISDPGKTAFWNQLRQEVKAWLQNQVALLDQHGEPVSLDRAAHIVRSARP